MRDRIQRNGAEIGFRGSFQEFYGRKIEILTLFDAEFGSFLASNGHTGVK